MSSSESGNTPREELLREIAGGEDEDWRRRDWLPVGGQTEWGAIREEVRVPAAGRCVLASKVYKG